MDIKGDNHPGIAGPDTMVNYLKAMQYEVKHFWGIEKNIGKADIKREADYFGINHGGLVSMLAEHEQEISDIVMPRFSNDPSVSVACADYFHTVAQYFSARGSLDSLNAANALKYCQRVKGVLKGKSYDEPLRDRVASLLQDSNRIMVEVAEDRKAFPHSLVENPDKKVSRYR